MQVSYPDDRENDSPVPQVSTIGERARAYDRRMGGDGRAGRRLLFHSYHFPPIGGSGVQRPLKMVRALARIGYESIVVTSSGATRDRWAPEDSGLLAEIPEHLEVRRVPNVDEPDKSIGWEGVAERWLGLQGDWSRWWNAQSYRAAVDGGTDFDLIYIWMQPYASAETGAALSRDLGKPWIADLGDPWALDEMMVYPSAFHRRLSREAHARAAANSVRDRDEHSRGRTAFGRRVSRAGRPAGRRDSKRLRPRRLRAAPSRLVATGSSASCTRATCTPPSASSTASGGRFGVCSAAASTASTS